MHYLCSVEDLADGKLRVFRISEGRSIVVIRRQNTFTACENRCPHAGAPLDDALIRGNTLTCVWHGFQFDLCSGACLEEPDEKPLSLLSLCIRDGKVYLDESHTPSREHSK